jgi:hypothetical protein
VGIERTERRPHVPEVSAATFRTLKLRDFSRRRRARRFRV